MFPEAESLLCIWHVEKNVEKNCRKYFHTAEDWDAFYAAWGRVMYAKTLDEFTSEWEGLVDVYNPRFALAVCYLEDELIRPLKRKFVTYWTNQHLHFGNRATSRGECNNGRLKQQLGGCSTGDLKTVVEAIETLLQNEWSEYLIKLNEAKMRIANDIRRTPLFRDLLGKVSPFALRLMLPQYLLIQNDQMKACTKTFSTTLGLPCAHKMEECGLGADQGLRLEDIHVHWHLRLANNDGDDLDDFLRVNEPATVRPTGRPPGARNKRRRVHSDYESTRRDPSGFEYSRELFVQAVANVERRTNEERRNEPSSGPSDPPINLPIDPALTGPLTAHGVAQQEEEARANAFFGPTTQERGGGRARGRGGRGGSHPLNARGSEGQFGVI